MPVGLQMQLLRVADSGGTVSVADIVVAVEPVKSVVRDDAVAIICALS